MKYKVIELDYVPNIEDNVIVRTGSTKEKALQNLESFTLLMPANSILNKELSCYLYPVSFGFEAVLIPTPEKKLKSYFKK